MKRIIDGVAYNTDTAVAVARSSYSFKKRNTEWLSVLTIYRTKGGAFFEVVTEQSDCDPVWWFEGMEPISYDKAYDIVQGKYDDDVELLVKGIFPTATPSRGPVTATPKRGAR
jgi:hypothetical protein